jgi:hypothetical protein
MRETVKELRGEMRVMPDELRGEIREGNEETRRYMRVLHEEVLSRIAIARRVAPPEKGAVAKCR